MKCAFPDPERLRTLLLYSPDRGTGYCFRSICLFISFFLCFFVRLFLCQQDYEKTAGAICMKFSGKVWSDHGTFCHLATENVMKLLFFIGFLLHRNTGAGFVVLRTTACYNSGV